VTESRATGVRILRKRYSNVIFELIISYVTKCTDEARAVPEPRAEAAVTESCGRDAEVQGDIQTMVQTKVHVVSPVEKLKRNPRRRPHHQVSDEAAQAIARTGPKKSNQKECDCKHESLLAMNADEWLPTYFRPGKALHGMQCFNDECESGAVRPDWPK
jgi:hypothetical protein